ITSPWAVAVDASGVYFTDLFDVDKMGLDGGTIKTLATAPDHPAILVLDEKDVYWTDNSAGMVMSVAKDGSNLTTLATGQDAPAGMAVDAQFVYWVNQGTRANSFTDGTVVRVAKPAPGTGGTVGGVSNEKLCGAACTAFAGCGVQLDVASCTAFCTG